MYCYLFAGVSRSPEKGAATSLNAAVNPEFAGQEAVFFSNCKPTQVKEFARSAIIYKNPTHNDSIV
jgi:hypothetical protein